MIVVLGRPVLATEPATGGRAVGGRAARIAALAVAGGGRVELVGSVGDDPEGDLVVVELGRAGVGHAAVLRDPAARTPVLGGDGRTVDRGTAPRLDAADVELGLRYVPDCGVLLVADDLPPAVIDAAGGAAAYHGASLVAIVERVADEVDWPEGATVLVAPSSADLGDDVTAAGDGAVSERAADEPDGAAVSDAFEAMVAAFCVRLDAGEAPATAFRRARDAAAWEPSPGD